MTPVSAGASTQNDAGLTSFARKSVVAALGKDQVFDAPMVTASEDFSYYRKAAPVYFMTLGIGEGAANHNPKFTVDESALQNGVKAQVQIILDYLNK
ncbi:M20/M25/M40 family metallo-hydrolase [Pontibacter sp. FD36]|uniref:M20/M25/M40 family metallo-hydrolase n=1 Tax=Pontibacter sp. FD36 TaxID=2789860 RepID=UPI0018A999DE|nr:M20/M25/M40 family metallo-hydrolase [Pontibacter sp. FD36]MBF8965231.1 M20/M25/M40 family metallo-hydrolase [Pontibacter sp. FD36]